MKLFRTGWPTIADMMAPEKNNLNALRLAAAFCVVVSHCALLKLGHEEDEPLAGLMTYTLGEHALHAFFYISGLTIAASLARATSITDFLTARVLRIWPALIAVSVLLSLVVGPLLGALPVADYFRDSSWQAYLLGAPTLTNPGKGLAGLFVDNPHLPIANGAPWTLKYEVICYAMLAGGMMLWGRTRMHKAMWVPALTFIAGLWMMKLPVDARETYLDHIARLWFAFGLGVMTWQAAAKLRPSVLIMCGLAFDLWLAIGGPFERPLAVLFIASVVLVFAAIPADDVRRFTNRIDLSYGVYIIAWPVTQVLVEQAPRLPLWAVTVATIVISSLLAWASWTFIEKPAMRLRPRIARVLEPVTALPWRLWPRRAEKLDPSPRHT
jgi:peptidoglycan/LPS O-acetylase OafA/YrhL